MKNTEFFKNERGISLVEVVASIVIIGVIFLSISGLLLQSKKTTVASETIVDSTYIAQQSMEEVYDLTQKQKLNLQKLQHYYTDPLRGGTLLTTPSDPQLIVELTKPDFKIKLHFQPLANDQILSSNTKLFNIVITVEHGKSKSSMENIIEIAL